MDAESVQKQLTNTGLPERALSLIIDVLKGNAGIRRAILYGSRAKGVAKANSDIDLAIEGLDDDIDVARLASALDDLPLPYRFDIQKIESIIFQPLKEHIKRAGIVIYQK